jgi:hypothetical protein
VKTLRPENFNHLLEIDPLEGFTEKILEDAKVAIDYNNDSQKEYCDKRSLVLSFLKTLIEGHHFRESVYHLAVLYIDVILLTNPNFNYEMAAYSCFLLASKK